MSNSYVADINFSKMLLLLGTKQYLNHGCAIEDSHLVIFQMYNEETANSILWDETSLE